MIASAIPAQREYRQAMPSRRRHAGRDPAQGGGESVERLPERRLGASAWSRVLRQQIDNHYRAFADPRASCQLLGFQSASICGVANRCRAIAMRRAFMSDMPSPMSM
jgi:hypothetical protein